MLNQFGEDTIQNSENTTSKKTGKPDLPWVKLVIVIFIVSAFTGYSFGFLGFQMSKGLNVKNDQENQSKTTIGITEEESAVVSAVEKNAPAVVSIIISKEVPVNSNSGNPFDFFSDPFFNPFGFERNQNNNQGETQQQEIGGGTGFIISSEGFILTNKHVVEDTDAQYKVVLNDESEYDATVLARDPVYDLAIIKINPDKELPSAELGDSMDLKIGQTVIAIGNSLGEFRNTVSKGIISGLKRSVVAGDQFGRSEVLGDVIQTDAAINPGNSGGPLINIAGEVIGVNVAVAQGAENIGFALPISQINRIYQQARTGEEIVIPFLGVRYMPITKSLQEQNSLPYDYGVLVVRGEQTTDLAVIPGSPADKANITENDIILEIDGTKLTPNNDLATIINSHEVGDTIKLKIWHEGSEKEIDVILEKRPSE